MILNVSSVYDNVLVMFGLCPVSFMFSTINSRFNMFSSVFLPFATLTYTYFNVCMHLSSCSMFERYYHNVHLIYLQTYSKVFSTLIPFYLYPHCPTPMPPSYAHPLEIRNFNGRY